jgi:hypothetical protein
MADMPYVDRPELQEIFADQVRLELLDRGDDLRVRAHLRDAYTDPDGDETVLHEYRLDLWVALATMTITQVVVEPLGPVPPGLVWSCLESLGPTMAARSPPTLSRPLAHRVAAGVSWQVAAALVPSDPVRA